MAPDGRGALAGQQLGGYQLLSLLGSGGMAEVYLARDPKLNRQVAVKVLPATLANDPEYVNRFRNEARQVAALEHEHIVPVYHFDADRGLLYLVMPVLRESLRDLLDRERPLPPEEAVSMVQQIASALEAAHRVGLVHRDVKPENILLDASGKAMLGDFGIARQLTPTGRGGPGPTLSASGLPVGTPEYMAPEQLRGEHLDQRADIYALGTVLYELLTGDVPYEADSPYEVAALALTTPLTPPSRRNPAIWPALEAVVLRAMATDPNERYQSASDFARALDQAMSVRPPRATAQPAPRPLPRATRRFSHPSAFPPPGLAAGATEAPTLPDLPALALRPPAARPYWTVGSEIASANSPARPQSRVLILAAAVAMLLVATLCGMGVTHALFGGGGLTNLGGGGGAGTPPFGKPPASGTSYVGGGGFPTQPDTTNTPGVIGVATPIVSASPGASATPTGGGGSTPTAAPSPALSFSSTTIGLYQFGPDCYGSQRITNNGQQPVGWRWLGPRLRNFAYSLNSIPSSSQGWTPGWPQDLSGIAPGGQETLYVRDSSNHCSVPTTNVTVQDTQGNTYPITVQQGG